MTAATYPHLHPEARGWAEEDDEARIARIRTRTWIAHHTAETAADLLREAMDQPASDRMLNVLLTGESGMGKTTLVRRFERLYEQPFDAAQGVQIRPVVIALMPPNPVEEEFFAQILLAIGAPATPHRVAGGSSSRTVTMRLLGQVGTRVLVLDELNSVLGGTARQQRLFLQLLRFLSNTLRVALVCTGTPEARQALLSDPQLRSRFVEAELPVWTADQHLQDFVSRLVQSIPLRQPSPIDSARIRRLVVERSGGVTEPICLAFRRAAINAVRSGRECIDLEGLETQGVWQGVVLPGQRVWRPKVRSA